MSQSPVTPPNPPSGSPIATTIENFWKLLDTKLVSIGVPAALLGIAISYARVGQWLEAGQYVAAAAGVWVLLRLGSKLAPRIDKLLDWSLNRAEKSVVERAQQPFADYQKQYLEALRTHCYDLEVEGFKDVLPSLALKDIYVTLRIDTDPMRSLTQIPTKTIWELLPQVSSRGQSNNYRLAIIADPGSGKTTLTRHLTLCFADGTFRDYNVQKLIPFLLLFRSIHSQIQTETMPTLPDLILQRVRELPRCQDVRLPRQWLEDQLKKGHCLVMLDGLDEVPEQRRELVSRWAKWQIQNYSTPFVVTSRPHGFDDSLFQGMHRVRIEKFNPKDRDNFILKWYRVITWRQKWETLWKESQKAPTTALSREQAEAQSEAEATKAATDLINQIIQSSAVKLAENPLLVTIIAATHRAFDSLPNRRVRLYQKVMNLLLEDRPNRRETRLPISNAEDNQQVLQILALELTRRETTQFTTTEGEAWIAARLKECDEGRGLAPEQFLKDIQNIAGLLVGGDSDLYQFSHKTFQEFLAAAELKMRQRNPRVVEGLVAKMSNPNWAEVIRFFAAMTSATPFVEAAVLSNDGEQLKLAYQMITEGSKIDDKIRSRLDVALQEADLGTALNATVQIEQHFQRLTQLSPTTGVTEPITWEEYRLFLADQADGQFHSKAALLSGTPINDTASVTGISWEDARWFCAWLCKDFQPESGVYDYRLPTPDEAKNLPGATITHPPNTVQTNAVLRVVRVQLPDRYSTLLNYLANGRWQEADEETYRVMLEVGDQQKKGYLDPNDLKNFPCEDLKILDQLWIKFSGGCFGFSVQKQIWVEVGGKLDFGKDERAAREAYVKMSDRVGWRKEGEWMNYSDFIFSTDAPIAHLPVCARLGWARGLAGGVRLGWARLWFSLLSHRDL